MEGNNESGLESFTTNKYYYQKRIDLDPERCKLNLERAVKRKQRESQAIVACDHSGDNIDKCQVESISYEELEEFHERYWNCPGSLNKRIFMATYLAVDPTDNDNKKDYNITCYCPRNDGTLDIICQKSFISVLGVSKHKVLGIGHAKLMNGEYLYKEKRGGKRWKSCTGYDEKIENINDNGINIYSNENSQNHSNSMIENDSTMGSNISESGGRNMNKKLSYLNTNEDNGESNKSSESHKKVSSQHRIKNENIMNENDDDDNAMFEPQVKNVATASPCDDEDENEGLNIFQPVVEITEASYDENDEDTPNTQPNVRRPMQNNSAAPHRDYRNSDILPPQMIRKQSTYESAEERMAARQKARAILENLHSQATMSRRPNRPPQFNQPYNHPNQMNWVNQPGHSNWQQPRNVHSTNIPAHRNFPSLGYMGPENWQRTLERNIRRRQRMQEVKINCNHNLTRFCKVISVPHEDLVNFHNMYWNCQGIVEERIFLAKYMVVTPCNHRREMAIATRIPTSDGQLVEVCQKSFLSVVGITKHKVQAAARAKLKGTLFRKDGRGGFQKPRSPPVEPVASVTQNIQITNVMERFQQPRGNQPKSFEVSETIEIEDSSDEERENTGYNGNFSNKNIKYEDSQMGNGDEDEEDDSQIMSAEDAFANGKLNYDEFQKNIRRNRRNEMHQIQLTRIKRELHLYKNRTKKLMLERKNYLVQLTKLRMENLKLKNRFNNKTKNENVSIKDEEQKTLKTYDGHQNVNEKTDSIEISKNIATNSNNEKSKDETIYNETNSIKNDMNSITNSNYDSDNFIEKNLNTTSNSVRVVEQNNEFQYQNS